jgi:hypothetical protein
MSPEVKKYAVVVALGLILVLGIGYLIFSGASREDTPPTPEEGQPFPEGETRPTLSVLGRDGGVVEVQNITDDPGTVVLDQRAGTYLFAGDELGRFEEGYQILYFEETQNFLISLYQAPIATVREEAEQVFLERTGLTESEACNTMTSVTTPYDIEPGLSGIDIGLSFCPGSRSI